ncbi:uncharacterized protein BDCG_02213 [Blastomyces dermatitidis ER-3]|uniref:Chromo domain-containing protein n=1 Tax=Ajellomyces dermatitidis (strain ER-3 / ATCC MYA-2586) TaxID=559297 RepID=A0ABP2EX88_AJEDR|nr:uncharacterized protein BDCG_02213 [Blastomyces dermatitidis ER-3]EEQ87093.1 hypothetical protein BDCG_02213 [Blastomyces dermatitidis ER-3]
MDKIKFYQPGSRRYSRSSYTREVNPVSKSVLPGPCQQRERDHLQVQSAAPIARTYQQKDSLVKPPSMQTPEISANDPRFFTLEEGATWNVDHRNTAHDDDPLCSLFYDNNDEPGTDMRAITTPVTQQNRETPSDEALVAEQSPGYEIPETQAPRTIDSQDESLAVDVDNTSHLSLDNIIPAVSRPASPAQHSTQDLDAGGMTEREGRSDGESCDLPHLRTYEASGEADKGPDTLIFRAGDSKGRLPKNPSTFPGFSQFIDTPITIQDDDDMTSNTSQSLPLVERSRSDLTSYREPGTAHPTAAQIKLEGAADGGSVTQNAATRKRIFCPLLSSTEPIEEIDLTGPVDTTLPPAKRQRPLFDAQSQPATITGGPSRPQTPDQSSYQAEAPSATFVGAGPREMSLSGDSRDKTHPSTRTPPPPPTMVKRNGAMVPEWSVAAISNSRITTDQEGKPRLEYKVVWEGYSDPSWEPKENVVPGCEDLINDFHVRQPKRPGITTLVGYMRFGNRKPVIRGKQTALKGQTEKGLKETSPSLI